MTLTFQKTETVTKEVDIKFPAYYRDGLSRYLIKSENDILCVYPHRDYFCISCVPKHETKAKLYELITKAEKITAKEFSQAFIEAINLVTDLLPDNDSLEFLVNSAVFKEAV